MGLFHAEAQIYLTLLHNRGPMRASDIVAGTGVPRGSIYAALTRLTDIGLLEVEAGYGGRFSAVPARRALSSLVASEKEMLSQHEQIAGELTKELEAVGEPTVNNGEAELIQVLRDPRVVAQRFDRLRLEAKRQIEVFVKAPIFAREGDPVQKKVLQRGVRVRGLYERAVLDVPDVKPFLAQWISDGEEARVYDGELPYKVALFDRQSILLPLVTASGTGKALFIKHVQLATGLGMLFEFLWEQAKPLALHGRKNIPKPANAARREGKKILRSNSNR